MSTITFPSPDADERRDNATFDAVMWAMARPGIERELPESGLLPVALALIDLESRIHCDAPELTGLFSETGAAAAPLAEADHVFLSAGLAPAIAAAVATGTALYPDEGATVVASVPLDGGPRLRLTGPGVDGAITIAPAIAPAFWEARARIPYPAGFELVLVQGRRVICLPRSTQVEVL